MKSIYKSSIKKNEAENEVERAKPCSFSRFGWENDVDFNSLFTNKSTTATTSSENKLEDVYRKQNQQKLKRKMKNEERNVQANPYSRFGWEEDRELSDFFREEKSDVATSAAEVNEREADAMLDLLSSTSESEDDTDDEKFKTTRKISMTKRNVSTNPDKDKF